MMRHRLDRALKATNILAICAGWSVSFAMRVQAAAEDQDRASPVVLISLDTLRADRLNCYGYAARECSPNIDALARDGILFETAIAAAPWTTPSQMSMLTSLYPSAHGVTQSFNDPRKDMFGQLTFNALSDRHATLAEVLKKNGFSTAAFTGGASLDGKIGFGRGFDVFEENMFKLCRENVSSVTEWTGAQKGVPFFLFWHTYEVHNPYLHPDYLHEVLSESEAGVLAVEIEKLQGGAQHALDHGEKDTLIKLLEDHNVFNRDVCEALYVGCVASADRWIGHFLRELRSQDLYDDALIVLTSDHGEEFTEHFDDRFYGGHGYDLYEEQVRIPLIVKLPQLRHSGRRIQALARNIDIMPTLLDVLGISAADLNLQGMSLRPFWEQDSAVEAAEAITESLSDHGEKKCIRTSDHKFIFSVDPHTVKIKGRAYMPKLAAKRELYDLGRDPSEKHNLLTGEPLPEHEALAATLERRLRSAVGSRQENAPRMELDPKTLEKVRALGYVK